MFKQVVNDHMCRSKLFIAYCQAHNLSSGDEYVVADYTHWVADNIRRFKRQVGLAEDMLVGEEFYARFINYLINEEDDTDVRDY